MDSWIADMPESYKIEFLAMQPVSKQFGIKLLLS